MFLIIKYFIIKKCLFKTKKFNIEIDDINKKIKQIEESFMNSTKYIDTGIKLNKIKDKVYKNSVSIN